MFGVGKSGVSFGSIGGWCRDGSHDGVGNGGNVMVHLRLDVGGSGGGDRRRRRSRGRGGFRHVWNDTARFANSIQKIVEELFEMLLVDDEVVSGESRLSIFFVAMFKVDLVQKITLRLGHVMRNHGILRA